MGAGGREEVHSRGKAAGMASSRSAATDAIPRRRSSRTLIQVRMLNPSASVFRYAFHAGITPTTNPPTTTAAM